MIREPFASILREWELEPADFRDRREETREALQQARRRLRSASPYPTDPEQCVSDDWWYAPMPPGVTTPVRTTAGIVERDAVVEHEVFAAGEQSMGLTIDQDMTGFPGQQRAMRSRAYVGSYLAGQESRTQRLHELVDDYLEGRRPVRGG